MIKITHVFWASVAALSPIVATAQVPQTSAALTKVGNWVPARVSEGVHALIAPDDYYGPSVGNVILIEQIDGFVVIDSGLTAADGRRVVAYAKYLAPDKPIKAVAITHWHNDHPQGVSSIRDAFPNLRIITTEATERGMLGPEGFNVDYKPNPQAEAGMDKLIGQTVESYTKLYHDPTIATDRKERIGKVLEQFERFRSDFKGTYIVPPTETFRSSLTLDDPLRPVELRWLGRANTEGDLIAWLPKDKIVATGDIVVSPLPFGFGSFPGDWIETLAKIKALGFSTLIPGHGQIQRDASYIDKLAATITDIRAAVGPLAKAGIPEDKVKDKADWTAVLAHFSDTPKKRAQFEGLFRDPMIHNAYREALGKPIVQGEGSPKPDFKPTPPKSTAKRHQT